MEIRPSNHLVNLIGQIDYFSGYWNGSVKGSDEKKTIAATAAGASAIAILDESLLGENEAFQNLLTAHFPEAVTSEKQLVEIFTTILAADPAKHLTRKQYLRSDAIKFMAPTFSKNSEKVQIFATVSPFLIGQRLNELLLWFKSNKDNGAIHPLLLIGTMHLCLLHIQPFSMASHAVALVTLWRNLIAAGYNFTRYAHLASVFASDPESYFSSLRQAEKTAYSSWNSLNIWLEYFLSSLLLEQRKLSKQQEQSVSLGRLTEVQRQLLSVVSRKGALSRDALATQTGINENTVKYNLGVLTQRGYLTRLGKGRTTSYALNQRFS